MVQTLLQVASGLIFTLLCIMANHRSSVLAFSALCPCLSVGVFFFSLLHTNFSFLKKHGWILFSGLSSSLFLYVCLFLRLLFGCRNVTVKRDEFISCFNYPFPPFFFLFSNLCYPFLRINGIGAIWSVFFCIFCSLILSFRFVILLTHLSLAFLYFFMGWGVG